MQIPGQVVDVINKELEVVRHWLDEALQTKATLEKQLDDAAQIIQGYEAKITELETFLKENSDGNNSK